MARADRSGLSTPAAAEPRRLRLPVSEDSFGRLAETIARNLGTARYLIIQTILVIAWITFNVVAVTALKFDKFPFILLNLAFSTQASYAAPLILLAQNRQEQRDREAIERDREEARRTQQDTEYLARELAAIRIALGDVATEADLQQAIERVLEATGTPAKKPKKKKRMGEPTPLAAAGAGSPDPESSDPDSSDPESADAAAEPSSPS